MEAAVCAIALWSGFVECAVFEHVFWGTDRDAVCLYIYFSWNDKRRWSRRSE